jgi:hypothetical protein
MYILPGFQSNFINTLLSRRYNTGWNFSSKYIKLKTAQDFNMFFSFCGILVAFNHHTTDSNRPQNRTFVVAHHCCISIAVMFSRAILLGRTHCPTVQGLFLIFCNYNVILNL